MLPVPGLFEWTNSRLRRTRSIIRRDIGKVASRGYALIQEVIEQVARIATLTILRRPSTVPGGEIQARPLEIETQATGSMARNTLAAQADEQIVAPEPVSDTSPRRDMAKTVTPSSPEQQLVEVDRLAARVDEFDPW